MKSTVIRNIFMGGAILFIASNAYATAPGELVNPNGYPSGSHFNLNIKTHDRDNFTCPDAVVDEVTGEPVYGNVIHIPSDGIGIQILMESGGKGPKSAPDATELEVTDWCTGFDNNDPAVVRIPKNEQGYAVYARVLGKPSDEEVIRIYDPGLEYVNDENNNDLIELGLVTDGVFPNYNEVRFSRPKGKVRAEPISQLFMWTGNVCDFDNTDFDIDDPANFAETQCCLETEPGSGVYSECIDPVLQEDGVTLLCDEGYVERIVYCTIYDEPLWVFNIADYVGYFWNIDSNGNNILKVRFYPLQNVSM